MVFVKAFLVGGAICMIGQLVINLTHLTNGKILVLFLISGAILQGFGLYEKLIEFAGAGASIPISGFGCALVKGAVEASKTEGFWGVLKGGLSATLRRRMGEDIDGACGQLRQRYLEENDKEI